MIAVDRAFDANDPQAAMNLLIELSKLRPRDPTVHNNFGCARVQVGDLRGASEAFRKSVELDPGYAQGAFNLALTLVDLDRLDDAQGALQSWMQRIREYPAMGLLAAKVEQARGRTTQARSLIDQVLAAPKVKPFVLFEAANILKNWKDRRAEDAFRRVMSVDPAMIGAPLSLANILRSSGRSAEARTILLELAKRMPDHPSILWERGGLNAQEGRLEEAVFDLDRAVGKMPELVDASILAAECLVRLGRPKEALLRLDAVLDEARRAPSSVRQRAERLKLTIEGASTRPATPGLKMGKP
jgi:predicted Zn-dependent protease